MASLQNLIESKQNFVQLIRLICDEYKLDPTLLTNITNIKAFLDPLSVDAIVQKATTLDDANKYLVKLYGETVSANTRSIVKDLDKVKNFMIQELKKPGDEVKNYNTESFGERNDDSSILTLLNASPEDRNAIIKYLNYSSVFRDEYIVIDSRYQNVVNTDPYRLMFALIMNTKTKSDHGGLIIGNPLQDIIEIEVYPFTIPYKPVYVTFYNRNTLTINEWTANSFEAYEGGQYHFAFDIDKVDNHLIYLQPVNSIYSFSKPVNQIDNFSLRFGAVYPKISFDADRMIVQSIDFTNEYGIFTCADPHNLVSGDLVYISGFSTPDPAFDVETISEVNRAEGHTIVKKDNYAFFINIDLSALRREDPLGSGKYIIEEFTQSVTVYFASKRIQIQMRLRYLTTYS